MSPKRGRVQSLGVSDDTNDRGASLTSVSVVRGPAITVCDFLTYEVSGDGREGPETLGSEETSLLTSNSVSTSLVTYIRG